MSKVSRSVIQSTVANFGNLAISLLLVIIVSRLLPPDVVGSYVMAYAVIMLVDPIRELQLTSYIIKQEKLDEERLRAISFVSTCTSLLAVAACVAGAAVLWLSYDSPSVGNCLLIMGLAFLSRPFSQAPMGFLARDMRYKPISAIKLGAALLKSAVTLGLILFADMGAEALAWGIAAETLTELLALRFVPAGRRFVWPSRKGTRDVFVFCTQYAGANLATSISVALAPLLIGAYQGLAMTAFYSRGKTVVGFFRSGVERAIRPIVMRELAKVQKEPDKIRDAYVLAISNLTGVSWPALACLVVLAEPMILTMFGQEWRAVVPISQVLTLSAMIFAATALSEAVHGIMGQTRILLIRQSAMQVPRVLLLVVTAPVSTLAVAWSIVAATALAFIVNQRLLNLAIGFDLRCFARAVSRSALVALVTGLAAYAGLLVSPDLWSPWLTLLVNGAVGALVWLAMLAIVRHPLFEAARGLASKAA